jgi:hypothetical protein
MTPDLTELEARLTATIQAAVAEIKANQDRAAESFATDLTEVRQETRSHLEAIDRRLDRISENVRSIDLRIGNMNR